MKNAELSHKQSIWKTHHDVEAETKERHRLYEKKLRKKGKRWRRLLTCACLFKKKQSEKAKHLQWLRGRNDRILVQRKNADDNYMYMD